MGHSLATPSIAWIAGFFDGDGSVALARTDRAGVFRYTSRMCLAQSERSILEAVQRVIGCGVIHEVPKSGLSRRTPYVLHWSGEDFMTASSRLLKQSVVKRSELLLVRGFNRKWAKIRLTDKNAVRNRDQHADQVRHQLQVLKGTLK